MGPLKCEFHCYRSPRTLYPYGFIRRCELTLDRGLVYPFNPSGGVIVSIWSIKGCELARYRGSCIIYQYPPSNVNCMDLDSVVDSPGCELSMKLSKMMLIPMPLYPSY